MFYSKFRQTVRQIYTHSSSPYRTHTCGDLRSSMVNQHVVLSGWIDAIRPYGPMTFLSLRDRYGITQLVLNKSDEGTENPLFDLVTKLNPETVVKVDGMVRNRPNGMINDNMKTGEVEVVVKGLEILNKCNSLPIKVGSGSKNATEETRLRYRYLDLRRPLLQNNLLIRSKVAMAARNYLCQQNFLEIETPTLFKSTPEGAREFLVPTRTSGLYYALPQSPQQYKQLLMVGGIDRYFQLARCYRDEGGRADRQPEFTQIDMEMSFVTMKDIQNVVHGMVSQIWKASHEILAPGKFENGIKINTMTYAEAMNRYGVDKPDTRYGLELQDISELLKQSSLEFFESTLSKNGSIKAINVKHLAHGGMSRRQIKELEKAINSIIVPGCGVTIVKIEENMEWKSSLTKKLTPEEIQEISNFLEVENEDVLVISAGDTSSVNTTLGRVRQFCAKELYDKGYLQEELHPSNYKFWWIVDFPLFEKNKEGGISATHHPFTAPLDSNYESLLDLLKQANNGQKDEQFIENLLSIKAQHFDIVCNGWELGGGSIRIHEADLQKSIMEDILKVPQGIKNSFNHLLDGLSHGCPPHGGIALGLDRLVAILCNAESIRDVIAFPKSTTGKELMTGSPSRVTRQQLTEYHIQEIGNCEVNNDKQSISKTANILNN